MKKFTSIVLTLIIVLSLCACGDTAPTDLPTESTPALTGLPTESTPAPTELPTESTPAPTELPTESTPAPTNLPAESTSAPTEMPVESTSQITPETDSKQDEQDSPGQTLYRDFKDRVSGGADISMKELAAALVENEIIPFAGTVMQIEPGFLNGFSDEINGFEEGAVFCPMIGSIPFIGYVFSLDADADVDDFMQQLKDNADLRWNICTQADEMVCEAEGSKVFFVMCPASFGG